ncbi:MAG TPA: S8 family serine peptidase [Gaiellaceae bacterium]|nr:S8 family serine peptidase [Gaiellaceae bacterium]
MGVRGRFLLVAGLASAFAPAASAAAPRLVTVGYRTPGALHGLRVVRRIPALRTAEVRVANERVAVRLRSRPGIRFVQRLVPRTRSGSPVFAQGTLAVPEWQFAAAHEDLVPSWVQQAAANVTIAVVDTGADLNVPSLAAKAPITWNVTTNSAAVSDQVGHGTFVASLAAGSISTPNAMQGFGGAAKLMIVQANRGGTGFSDVDEANAIVWATDHGANIINLSLGGTQTSVVERSAVQYAMSKGVLLVAAAGNSAQEGNPTVYPAALIGRSGLVVGAADEGGARASFSTTGSYVDLLAPGVDVLGALANGVSSTLFAPASTPGAFGSYGYGSGTSYAAPEIAGAAALVLAANPSLSATAVAQTLEATASGSGTWTNALAFGDVNVAAAVQRALGGAAPTLVQPPILVKPKQAKPKKNATTEPAGKKRSSIQRPG